MNSHPKSDLTAYIRSGQHNQRDDDAIIPRIHRYEVPPSDEKLRRNEISCTVGEEHHSLSSRVNFQVFLHTEDWSSSTYRNCSLTGHPRKVRGDHAHDIMKDIVLVNSI